MQLQGRENIHGITYSQTLLTIRLFITSKFKNADTSKDPLERCVAEKGFVVALMIGTIILCSEDICALED